MAPERQRPMLAGGERLIREVDRGRRGPPDKFHPFSVDEAIELLRPQVEALATDVSQLAENVRGDRVIFQATLLPNYLAASWFPDDLLTELDLKTLGARRSQEVHRTARQAERVTDTRSLVVAGTNDAITSLQEIMAGQVRTRSEQKAREDLQRFSRFGLATREEVVKTPPIDVEPNDVVALEAVLHPDPDRSGVVLHAVSGLNWQKWIDFIEGLGGSVEETYRREIGGLTFVPVRLPAEAEEQVSTFNLLRAIRPLPVVQPRPAPLLRSAQPILQPPGDTTPRSDARIAIFDGGVDDTSPFFPGVVCVHAPAKAALLDDVWHGSVVTGAVLYGNLRNGESLPQPAAKAIHVRVTPPDDEEDLDAYWALDQIRTFVEGHDVDIVNLSLGPDAPVEDDDEPHPWTLTLDELAYEHGVLFVVAPGNHGERPAGYNRIASPADMANGLSVGACTAHAPDAPWQRATYSPVGPGRTGSRVQPTGVQFGGCLGNRFIGVMADGRTATGDGTSFAAPLVTHSLATLAPELPSSRFRLNNLRAFAVHFAEPPDGHAVTEVGHGRFRANFDDVLECGPNEMHLLYEGTVRRDQVLGISLPWPDDIDSGTFHIRGTLVYTSPVEPTQPLDYTQAALELTFRPDSRRYRMSQQGQHGVVLNLVEQADEVARLSRAGFTPAANPVSRSVKGIASIGDEEALRDAGKWDTVRVFWDSLRASSLHDPRLDLTYVSRESGHLTRGDEELEYSLLLTVQGPKTVALYDSVRAQYSVLSPLPVPLEVQERTRLNS